jgi:DNA-binding response OmpR family regulator
MSGQQNNPPHEPMPRVLIVDDMVDVANLLAGLFWLKGIEPVKALSIDECLASIGGQEEKRKRIDAAILNGRLAVERGALLVSRLKEAHPEIAIFVLVGDESDRARLLRLGCEDFAKKPISAETIVDKVLVLIARKSMDRANNNGSMTTAFK